MRRLLAWLTRPRTSTVIRRYASVDDWRNEGWDRRVQS